MAPRPTIAEQVEVWRAGQRRSDLLDLQAAAKQGPEALVAEATRLRTMHEMADSHEEASRLAHERGFVFRDG